MTHHSPSSNSRNLRTFIASLLAYVLLTSQLAPVAMAFNGSANRKASAPTPDIERKKTSEAPPQGHIAGSFAPVPVPLRVAAAGMAPIITATKTDSFTDVGGGRAAPGSTITYSITIQNTGPDPATNVTLNDTVDPNTTILGGSAKATPILFNDTYDVLGNVRIQVPDGASDLLANDIDPDTGSNAGLTITTLAGDTSAPFAGTSTQGGEVTAAAGDGSFAYNPPPGFAGTDTFTYTVTDTDGNTSTATVTLTITGMIWFVNSAAGAGGDGRLTTPFNCLVGAGCFDPVAADDPGDNIFLYSGSYTGGLTLLNNQKLIGQGASSGTTLDAIAGVTVPSHSDALPALNGNSGSVTVTTSAASTNGVNLAVGASNTLRGFTIGNTTGADIASGASFGTLTVLEVTLNGTGRALDLTSGTLAATFENIASASSSGGPGINLATIGGSLTVSGTTSIAGAATQGISISGSSVAANFGTSTTIGSTTQGILVGTSTGNISFGNTAITAGTDGVSLQNNSAGTRSFGSLSTTNGSGVGFLHGVGGGAVTVSGQTTITNPGGRGIDIQNSTTSITFANTNVTQTGGTGVFLGSNSGAVTFADLDISPDAGQRALQATNNTGTITSTSGDITATGNVTLEIVGLSVAARTPLAMVLNNLDSTNSTGIGVDLNFVSGNFTVNDATLATSISNPTGIGIRVLNSGAGTINFGNTNVSASGGTGVVLGTASNGNAGNVTFADLDITPDSGQRALHALQNTATITSTSGTVSSTSAIAVEIAGVSSGSRTPLNLQFESLSANGSSIVANGLVLTNTSAAGSPGGFRVNGTGTTDGSGGIIQNTTTRGANINTAATVVLKNMNFTSANNSADAGGAGVCDDLNIAACNAAIYLNTVSGATMDNLNLTGTMVENGITAIGVSDFKLDNSLLDGCGNEPNESCVEGSNLSGTSTVNGTEISFSETNSFDVVNSDVNLNLTINGSTFRDTQTVSSGGVTNTNGEGGFQFRSFSSLAGTPTTTINILSSSFLRLRTQGIQAIAEDDTILNIDITGNTIDSQADIGTGIDLNANDTAFLNFNVLNNPVIRSRGGSAVNITTFLNGQGEGRVNDNGSVGSPILANGIGIGLRFLAQETSDLIVEARRNFVAFDATNTDTATIDAQARFQNAKVDLTLEDNTSTVNNANVADINLTAGSSTAGESNQLCANVVSNNASGTGAARAFRVRVSALTAGDTVRLFLEGFVEAGTPTQDAEATWNAKGNTPVSAAGSEVVASLTGAAVDPSAPPGGACLIVDTLSDFGPVTFTYRAETGPAEKITASSNSITSRPFISSPQPQTVAAKTKPAAQTPVARAVVVDPGLRYRPKPKPVARPTGDGLSTPPDIVGDTLTWNVGTLPAGQSVTITFQVVVDSPFTGGTPQVSNQGTVTADGGISVLTDDPSTGASNDPTITLIAVPPDVFIRDARVAEPTSGSTPMLFTLALSAPATEAITINYSTASGGGNPATAGSDYTAVVGGSTTFIVGQRLKTISVDVLSDADNAETDETFVVNITPAVPAQVNIVDGLGLGTITTANPAGTVLISELRTSGPGGGGDDFVEIYNNTDSPHTVPAGGYGLFKMGADCDATPVLIGTIPAATVIPQRGHYLFVDSTYSLGSYAAGDVTLTFDIENDSNVALFSTTDVGSLSTVNRLDAVGFGLNTGGGVCDLLREGTTLGAASGSTSEYTFARKFTVVSNNVPTPTDANNNAADFNVVSTTPSTPVGSNAAPILGAPGPENLASPNLKKFDQVGAAILDTSVSLALPPNRVRKTCATPAEECNPNRSALGTLSIRRKFTNNTGGSISRLRFRIYDITTFPVPVGTADIRAITSGQITVTGPGIGTVTVEGTTLEEPPTQALGGGMNSSMAAGTIALANQLPNGSSINLQFLFGVQQGGNFRVFVIVEALP